MTAGKLDLSAIDPPQQPGVYIFRDGRKRPIYIGKAKSLKDRLTQYAQQALPTKTMLMLAAAKSVDWIVLKSEMEALLTESAMVRTYLPKYNILLRDDKRFPLILLTDEPFPKAIKVRKARHGQGRHYGPYRGETAAVLLDLISRRFRLRRCSGPLPKRNRPCVDHEIGRCDAPCVGRINREDYAKLVEAAAEFLRGRSRLTVEELRAEMDTARAELDFERAARLRDEIRAIAALAEEQNAEKPGRDDADALAVAAESGIAAAVVLERRRGVVLECRHYVFELPLESDEREVMLRLVAEHYREAAVPARILVGEPFAGDAELAGLVPASEIARPQRGPDAALLGLAQENARELLRRETGSRGSELRNAALLELQRILELEKLPREIEGYDISTMSGRNTVASGVRFSDGLPKKALYRLYKIKGREDSDVDALAEVLGRRARRKEPLPDLILIDGGMGQLQAAAEALAGAGMAPPVMIGLEKREELIRTLEGELIRLPRHSAGLRLLQHVRDEAHRFGKAYHVKLRGRGMKRKKP